MYFACRYGISNEPLAAQRYQEVLQTLGHDVTIAGCGLLVNPAYPWLGASPDRIAFDPVESSYGVVEIKCPYTLRDKKGSELTALDFCSQVTENGPNLKKDHFYYAQLLGQMGVSGLRWGDFVVFGKEFILIERIRMSESEWATMKTKLDDFYFNTLMPYLENGK